MDRSICTSAYRVWPLTLLVAGVLLVSTTGCDQIEDILDREDPSLQFTVVFDESHNLKTGQYVTYNGIRIGQVEAVELTDTGKVRVDVTVRPDYTKHVYREAQYTVEKPGGMFDLSGERVLAIEDRSVPEKHPVQDGDIVEGYDGWWDSVESGVDQLEQYTQQFDPDSTIAYLQDGARDLRRYGETLAEQHEEIGTLIDLINATRQDLTDAGLEKARRILKKRLPEINKTARSIREHLREESGKEEAKQFWNLYLEWRESLLQSGAENAGQESE